MNISRKVVLFVLMITVLICSSACGNNDTVENATADENITTEYSTENTTISETTQSSTTNTTITDPTTEPTTQTTNTKTEPKTQPTSKNIVSTNKYKTRYQEVNMVTYPTFVFNYSDNWRVTQEECNQEEEKVVLENNNGVKITFLHYSNKIQNGGSTISMRKDKISKVSLSRFVPGKVQATDYSSLGEFMVAKIKTIGELNMKLDSEYKPIDGNVSYAVLPISEIGTRSDVRNDVSGEYSFWYASTISFTATSANNIFTEQEEREVISILHSFRLA